MTSKGNFFVLHLKLDESEIGEWMATFLCKVGPCISGIQWWWWWGGSGVDKKCNLSLQVISPSPLSRSAFF